MPHKSQKTEYSQFMLTHFKAFSKDERLYNTVSTPESILQEFETYEFSQCARAVMENWEVLNESSNACDADHLKKEHASKK